MRAIVIAVVVLVAGCATAPPGSKLRSPCKVVVRKSLRGEETVCEDLNAARVGPYVLKLPNNIVVERSRYVDGVLDGDYAAFYPNGAKRTEGRYVRGARDGVWRSWHENGKPWLEGAYAGGVRSGRWVEYEYTGAIAFEGTYVRGALDGPWKAYADDGSVRATGASARGALEGVVERRFRDGMRIVMPYRANRGHGTMKVFDKDGKELQSVELIDGVEQKQPEAKPDAP